MKNYFSLFAFLTLLLGLASCTNDTTPEQEPDNDMVPVRFSSKPYVDISTRATGNDFQIGDEIGIFCVDTATAHCDSVSDFDNYADNLRYRFNGESFRAVADSIMQYRHNVNAFTYYFIYPFSYAAKAEFQFTANRNQHIVGNYTKSDLALQKLTTRDTDIVLQMKRMMANVNIRVLGSNLLDYTMSAKITNVFVAVNVDLNAQKVAIDSTTSRKQVTFEQYVKNSDVEAGFHAVIAPQRLTSTQQISLTVGDTTYPIPLPNDWSAVNIPSGYQLTMTVELEEETSGEIRLTYGGEALEPIPMHAPRKDY